MISYAQNREDVVLARGFADIKTGFYIDVGAADPVNHSVTKHFYDLGWSGINIEPTRAYHSALCEQRTRDINLRVGASNREGSLPFYQAPDDHLGESTFSAPDAERHLNAGLRMEEHQLAVTTLEQLCKEHVRQAEVNFLKIDVEGHEKEVIEGANWKVWRPLVVVVEATHPNTNIPSHKEWEHLLLEAGYECALFDGLNRFYVRGDERALRSLIEIPSNVLDKYVPYEYLTEISERDSALAKMRTELGSLEDRKAEFEAEIDETNNRISQLSDELARTTGALDATRRRLQRSESIIADLKIQLAAADSALTEVSKQLAAKGELREEQQRVG